MEREGVLADGDAVEDGVSEAELGEARFVLVGHPPRRAACLELAGRHAPPRPHLLGTAGKRATGGGEREGGRGVRGEHAISALA